jgi:hypothetical protein
LARASAALLYSRTKSAIGIGQFFSPPLHSKATIRNSSHHNRTEMIICNARANPCASYFIPLKLRRLFRWVTPRLHGSRLARRIKLLDFLNNVLACFASNVSVPYVFGECELSNALHCIYTFNCITLLNFTDLLLIFWLFFIQIVKLAVIMRRDACTCTFMPLINQSLCTGLCVFFFLYRV